jgi:hypothetical protein
MIRCFPSEMLLVHVLCKFVDCYDVAIHIGNIVELRWDMLLLTNSSMCIV